MSRAGRHFTLFAALSACIVSVIPEATAQSPGTRTTRSFDGHFRRVERDKSLAGDDGLEKAGLAIAPGVRAYAGAAVVGGYDSNPDGSSGARDKAGFGLVELGTALVFDGQSSQTTALARGSFARYDMDFRPDRGDATVLLDHYVTLPEGWSFNFGAFHQLDHFEIDRPSHSGGYALFSRRTEAFETFVRLRSLHTGYGNAVGTVLPQGFLSEVDSSFSNIRSEAATGVLLFKNRFIAPFAEIGAAHVDFTRQVDPNVLDRDARDLYGIAGIRVTFSPQLRFDLGARTNHREFERAAISDHSSTFLDGKVVWTPHDRFYAEVNIDRTFTDPMAAGSLLTERTAAELHLNAKLTDRLYAEIDAGVVRNDQVGIDRRFDERYAQGKIGYHIDKRTEVFSFVKGETVKEKPSGDESDRMVFGAGVKIGY